MRKLIDRRPGYPSAHYNWADLKLSRIADARIADARKMSYAGFSFSGLSGMRCVYGVAQWIIIEIER